MRTTPNGYVLKIHYISLLAIHLLLTLCFLPIILEWSNLKSFAKNMAFFCSNKHWGKVWVKRTRHIQKFTISKKCTIFFQSSWNLVKMNASLVNHFHQVSWGLNKNCGFFTNSQFLSVSDFSYSDLTFLRSREWCWEFATGPKIGCKQNNFVVL